jgi:hypothetical protein
MDAVMPKMAPDVRRQFNRIKMSYLQRYGIVGLYERANNRTVSIILAGFDPSDELKLIKSGEVGGGRYELYAAPDEIDNKPPSKNGDKGA